ncbi:protein zer-1 homolog [Mercenaria mercenaria]|uniref:protein zer-1 homolog n=1 Tax=Mercenaria mercenaria TaxID=6596 RepID=UPI00234EF3CB|nr:protein zer-1 homolog [Mercenaria mercenaria]XP_045198951.2 protein zer-1 homolog [Mercenaria mercenaria]
MAEVYRHSDALDIWPANTPSSLEDICIIYFLDHIFKFLEKTDDSYRLKQGITFPQGLSDKLLAKLVTHTKHLQDTDDNVFGIFNNRATTSLTELPLRYTAVSSDQLSYLCLHPLREIDIAYCSEIKGKFVKCINQAHRTLRVLQLGGYDQFERMEFLLEGDDQYSTPSEQGDGARSLSQSAIFVLPNLRSLSIRDINAFRPIDGVYIENVPLIDRVIRPLKSLTHLDLCDCHLEKKTLEEIGDLDLPNLMSLSMCDVLNGCETALDNLCRLTTLRHLDVSQGDDTTMFLPVQYPKPTDRLQAIIASMPNLRSLDISGTNLAGYAPVQKTSHRLEAKSKEEDPSDEDVGLPGSDGRQFNFLGLLNCADNASHRKNIPAQKVTGDFSEEQILLAVHVYRDKPNLLTRGFNYLFNRFRFETVKTHCLALEGILSGMERNKHDKHVQISGSASLFYIVKGCKKDRITHTQKRRVIGCLLDAMERHMAEHTMMRNGCLTLCHFNIPYEVLYCYNRLVRILLQMLRRDYNDDFLLRIGIFLLNSLACQVEGEHKQILGQTGVVEIMSNIIKLKVENRICDEILEVCWSTLWNVTDETETNCVKFMEQGGMYLFLDCFKMFPDKEELLRNMMGLMGNIAEVQKLRKDLMNKEYVTVFTNFLESTKDGIEVSYNAAGVLSHLLSDQEEEWTIESPSRQEVISRIVQAIKRWPLDSKRNINYRSFGPILHLVKCYQSHASQYWAVWALCNLTQVYPDKYCQLLKDEGGLELLEIVTRDPRPIDAIKQLAEQVITFINNRNCLPPCENVDDVEMNGDIENGNQ